LPCIWVPRLPADDRKRLFELGDYKNRQTSQCCAHARDIVLQSARDFGYPSYRTHHRLDEPEYRRSLAGGVRIPIGPKIAVRHCSGPITDSNPVWRIPMDDWRATAPAASRDFNRRLCSTGSRFDVIDNFVYLRSALIAPQYLSLRFFSQLEEEHQLINACCSLIHRSPFVPNHRGRLPITVFSKAGKETVSLVAAPGLRRSW
jgi:hypothetical protein